MPTDPDLRRTAPRDAASLLTFRRRLTLLLIATSVAFAIATALAPVVAQFLGETSFAYRAFAKLTATHGEANPPAWFSALLLATIGVLAALIATARDERRSRISWILLALTFACLSLDEAAKLHEMGGEPAGDASGRPDLSGVWPVVAVLIVPLFALVMFRFWIRRPPPIRHGLLLAAIFYLSGAFVLDLVGSALMSRGTISLSLYRNIQVVEELAEMVGAIIAIHTLLAHPAIARAAVALQDAHASAERRSPTRPAEPAADTRGRTPHEHAGSQTPALAGVGA